ncbi:hypothetical protein BCR42DRAFT_408191 [Absidia repens]|uniref:Uncharacterized protein n=1 Tax=Absidia repens TaxID=90262 RepID=A0A1X2IR27_9FUNG|nr:hypothetical protein BCR42DRAFT_408191 [Absidia repens]
MLSKIIDTLRTNSNSNTNSNNNNSTYSRHRNIPEINVERRSSTDEDSINNGSPTSSGDKQQRSPSITDSLPSSPNQGISPITPTAATGTATRAAGMKGSTDAIGIKKMGAGSGGLTDTVVYPDGRRRSSLFGYSTNAADDYMQKDLLSSSWS